MLSASPTADNANRVANESVESETSVVFGCGVGVGVGVAVDAVVSFGVGAGV
jgi:ribose 5-phosphate isomerase RpiB